MKKKIRDFLKQFFYRDGQLSAGKFWATIFSILFVLTYILRLMGWSTVDNTLVGLMLGSLSTVVGFYTVNKRPPQRPPTNQD